MKLLLIVSICLNILSSFAQYPIYNEVTGLPNQNQQVYNGWISSNASSESFLYYQLYSCQGTTVNTSTMIPIILYLEGGPGDSSTLTMFAEGVGPYGVQTNFNLSNPSLENIEFTLTNTQITWTESYHLLSIDNPVFVGYSFSMIGEFVQNTNQAAQQLITFLGNFFTYFPSLTSNPLYIYGRSYGGHYAPALAYQLMKQNYIVNGTRVMLAGLIVADGLLNLANQSYWSEYIYAAGASTKNWADFQRELDIGINLQTWAGNLYYASAGLSQTQYSLYYNETPNLYVNNFREYASPSVGNPVQVLNAYLGPQLFLEIGWTNITTARKVFDISPYLIFNEGLTNVALPFFTSGDLAADFSYCVEALLNEGLDILIFNGQDDTNLHMQGTWDVVNGFNWPGIKDFRTSPRKSWFASNGTVIGSIKEYENLHVYSVWKSGHLGTLDQPASILQMLQEFIG